MDFLSDHEDTLSLTSSTASDDTYDINLGKKIRRVGKVFSYTYWRTEINGDIFWSLQGNRGDGSVWIVTKYFGSQDRAHRYRQEIILHHPQVKKIKMFYTAQCVNGSNTMEISRDILNCFRDKNNDFHFDFRLIRVKKRRNSKN